ncbi:hypothetical protein DSOUD_1554 [Desulfuromonas soudanensis]|uniref:Uncharacterized protein n=1 Tax=Desulfuromonas soudanensis TaxID=1603606 RepID=A0A0M3QFM6_9BACT|nr:C-GCAxxG-C-C family (seleno)protein [Desulfuromonas soudanensis]ALC16333.1 hypothetical protein DSOUD_1554 [Desulfuromonas soudanensis]
MSEPSRREFLKTGVGVIAGAALVGGVALTGAKEAEAAVTQPFGYIPLDVETTRQLGYDGYKGIIIDGVKHAHCGFASFNAITSQLKALDPYGPYANIPPGMMDWAASGVAGFASFCGALNGACAAVGLICTPADANGFISDLLTWYTETLLPSNIVAPTGILPQSLARTTLCHNSVTNWCLASGMASGSPERSERCARLAGDVAAKTVEMLNNGRLGLPTPASKTVCVSCHYTGTDYAAGQFTRGNEDCTVCHTGIKKIPAGGHRGKS